MHPQKKLLIFIILLGGLAVLGSYVYGFQSLPDAANLLWGGVAESWRPAYTINMLLAASGYFVFTAFILFRLNPTETRIYGRFGYGLFNFIYAAILIPSALWMPFTMMAIEQGSAGLEWAARIMLWIAGLASLALLFALLTIRPSQPRRAHWLAVAGCVFFCIQTVILDAIVWNMLFQL